MKLLLDKIIPIIRLATKFRHVIFKHCAGEPCTRRNEYVAGAAFDVGGQFDIARQRKTVVPLKIRTRTAGVQYFQVIILVVGD